MASGGSDPPRFAPPHDTGTDARRTADGSVPADTTPPLPQDASGLPEPSAAATVAGGSGASPGNASRRAEQSAVAELTTLVRTLAASVRELRADGQRCATQLGRCRCRRPVGPGPLTQHRQTPRPRATGPGRAGPPPQRRRWPRGVRGCDRIPTPAPRGLPMTTSRHETPAAAAAAAATAPAPGAAAFARGAAPARGSPIGQLRSQWWSSPGRSP